MNRAEMVTVNGIEKKRSRIRSVFKKNAEIYRVIGCSQLTGGNDDDEYDSIAYIMLVRSENDSCSLIS